LITTGLKITTDLERIGDNAVNICERTLELREGLEVNGIGGITQMAEIAQSMVRDSLEAFTRKDVALAKAAIARDDEVDNLDREIYKNLPRHMAENPEAIPRDTAVLFISKFLERIADHATNVAEMVVFMVEGHTIRHMDTARIGLEKKIY
jgi:phosphate transport system protein